MGAPMLSLCQTTAVSARTRCQIRMSTPAGVRSSAVLFQVELALVGVEHRFDILPQWFEELFTRAGLFALGRLLSAGGTLAYPGHISGRADAVVFDPKAQQWSGTGHMAHGRWYPTLVTLGDGRVFAASGRSSAFSAPGVNASCRPCMLIRVRLVKPSRLVGPGGKRQSKDAGSRLDRRSSVVP
jgi:hypothetical protein